MKNTRNKKQIHFLMHKNFTFLMHQGGIQNTIKWNKYRSQLTKQAKTNNLYYSIDPTFNKVNRLFVLQFENENRRASF